MRRCLVLAAFGVAYVAFPAAPAGASPEGLSVNSLVAQETSVRRDTARRPRARRVTPRVSAPDSRAGDPAIRAAYEGVRDQQRREDRQVFEEIRRELRRD